MALQELSNIRHQRLGQCAQIERRLNKRPTYALTTALELLSVEVPRIGAGKCSMNAVYAVVRDSRKRYHSKLLRFVSWSWPLEVVEVADRFRCTSPACTWAMMSGFLSLEELVVLADSMMRRDGRLKRTSVEELAAFLDLLEEWKRERDEDSPGEGHRLPKGFVNCRRVLRLVHEGTDSSQETRTRLVLVRYGLDCPQVNWTIRQPGTGKPLLLDMAYPEFRIAIEYDGSHHASQWAADSQRRQWIEDAGWEYVQVTVADLRSEEARGQLARRVAAKIAKTTGRAVDITMPKTDRQLVDGRSFRRKPLWERMGIDAAAE